MNELLYTPLDNSCPEPGAVIVIDATGSVRDSLLRFFKALPAGLNVAFIVMFDSQDVTGPGLTTAALCAQINLPVSLAADGMTLRPGTVLLAGSSDIITLDHRQISVRPGHSPGQIDALAISLAKDLGNDAVLVTLAGRDTISTIGLSAVKDAGGLTLAETAVALPAAAGMADVIIPAEQMPARIVAHLAHRQAMAAAPEPTALLGEQITVVAEILLRRTGHDFRGYKHPTFARRLARRMRLRQISDPRHYLDVLNHENAEVQALFQDLLIGVTQFFRDASEFELLAREAFPALMRTKNWGDKLRIWALGCSTGEEAYSLAILALEQLEALDAPPSVQIFATDIDERALTTARAGRFSTVIEEQIAPARLARWFTREGETYVANKELREICVFSAHNILRDPPFSRIDLISCRNLLIYLTIELQNQIIPLFHFALQPNGILFLGPAENVSRHDALFEPIEGRHRIFRRRTVAAPPRPQVPLPNQPYNRPEGRMLHPTGDDDLAAQAERLAASHAPAYVVVDDKHDVLHFSSRMGRYLEPAPGQATLNLMTLVHRDLRLDLRCLLQRVAAEGKPAKAERLSLSGSAGPLVVNLLAERMPQTEDAPTRLFVLFQDAGSLGAPNTSAADDPMRQLESELTMTRERLQSAVEELETTNEELKTSNEEYQGLNEELQSTNEALETSKEELQSLNEELQTVNTELAHRVSDLAHSNSDLRNVLESTQIAIVFLDNDLCIKSFTPTVTDLFELTDSDRGRPITHITTNVVYPELAEDVRRVLRTLGTVEREVSDTDRGRRYLVRVLPYRNVRNFIAGTLLTFLDITAAHLAEHALRDSEERFRMIASSVPAFLFIATPDFLWEYVNPPFYTFTGMAEGTGLGDGWFASLHPDGINDKRKLWREATSNATVLDHECRFRRADGTWSWFLLRAVPQVDSMGRVLRWFGSCTDITERRRAERRQRLLLAELQHRVKNILAVVRSVLTRTLESSTTLEDFSAHLAGRIGALARTQGVLARTADGAVMLDELVHEELAAHGGGDDQQVDAQGPPVLLPDRVAETLGLAMHELTTNALKYGALSLPTGMVRVNWRVHSAMGENHGAKLLRLEWQESGVPLTDLQPGRRGFGRELIEQGLPYELGATTTLEFLPGGVRCTIELEIDDTSNRRMALVLDPS